MKTRVVISVEQKGRVVRRFGIRGERLRLLVAFLVLAFVVGVSAIAGITWQGYARWGNGPSARAENVLLRSRLQALELRQARVDRTLDRVMASDAKIRQLTREDSGARGFGIGPLSELEVAAAERDGLGVLLPGEEPQESRKNGVSDLEALLDDLDRRTQTLEDRTIREEESLQEVRAYLDDRTSLLRANPSTWPVRGWLTSGFGWRRNPVLGTRRLHTGLDIAAPRGTPVIAPADGHVVFAGYHSAYGNLVVIDHGYGITTKYAHTSRVLVRAGQRVQRGDVLARVGNTGRSTGPHLHFEVHKDGVPTNPMRYLTSG
ncbi:MAG TPA: peptidase M23 [Deltaproteobacteria bacterium]|nr:peptidase M23 [Deltaproteobacteria bacterium]HCP47367.1 peptidase M23 [Deltaproteobacteria bacterium]